MTSGAILSECGRYRYRLWRTWDEENFLRAAFVMLNPSIADAEQDDPTIRRCIGFAKSWGCGGIVVVNLFAWRSTDPKQLKSIIDPVGPENDRHIRRVLETCSPRICAWGNHGTLRRRDEAVKAIIRGVATGAECLRLSKDGHPGHPLYLPADSVLLPFVEGRS